MVSRPPGTRPDGGSPDWFAGLLAPARRRAAGRGALLTRGFGTADTGRNPPVQDTGLVDGDDAGGVAPAVRVRHGCHQVGAVPDGFEVRRAAVEGAAEGRG